MLQPQPTKIRIVWGTICRSRHLNLARTMRERSDRSRQFSWAVTSTKHQAPKSKSKSAFSGKPPANVNWMYKMKIISLTALYIDKQKEITAQTRSTTRKQVGRNMHNWTLSFFWEQNSQLSWLRFQKYLDTRGFYPQGDRPWNWNYTRFFWILSHAYVGITHVIFIASSSLAHSTDFYMHISGTRTRYCVGGLERAIM